MIVKKYSVVTKRMVALLCGLTHIFLLNGIPTVAYSSDGVIDTSSEAILENESSSGTAETLSSPAGSSSPDLIYS